MQRIVTIGDDPPTSQPGALVRVSMDSSVGVLLDELPTVLRDRATAEVLARPASYWVASAPRQLSATRLRLTYRKYYAELVRRHVWLGSRNAFSLSKPRFPVEACRARGVDARATDYPQPMRGPSVR